MDIKEKMIKEEQKILDDIIGKMDDAINHLKDMIKAGIAPKGDLEVKLKELEKGKDELYHSRIKIDQEFEGNLYHDELLVGLHSYYYKEQLFIFSWVRSECRPFF